MIQKFACACQRQTNTVETVTLHLVILLYAVTIQPSVLSFAIHQTNEEFELKQS